MAQVRTRGRFRACFRALASAHFLAGAERPRSPTLERMERFALLSPANARKPRDKSTSRAYNTYEHRKSARVVERRAENPPADNAVGSGSV